MTRIHKMATTAFLTLLLLSACGRQDAVSKPITGESGSQSATSQATVVSQEALNRVACLYEAYLGGTEFSNVLQNDDFGFIVYGWLAEQQKLDEFTKDATLTIPAALGNQLAGLFFDITQSARDPQQMYVYGIGGKFERIILEAFSVVTKTDDAGLETIDVVYGRFAEQPNGDRQWLYPVKYSFAPYILTDEEIPDIAKTQFAAGDTAYRIVNVSNNYDDQTAKALYTEHGFGELVEQKSYVISTAEDLRAMADRVNGGKSNEITAAYTLANDIDLQGADFTPIGTNPSAISAEDKRNPYSNGFCGTFDGGGHTISNLLYTGRPDQPAQIYHYGLFSVVGAGGQIFDLTIENAQITYQSADMPPDTTVHAGILAGAVQGAAVKNCHVSGSVSGISEVGGLVGIATADFTKSYENPRRSIISGCTANAQVTGSDALGGLVGTNHYTSLTNSRASGTVTAVSMPQYIEMPRNIGGLVGHNIAAVISESGCDTTVKTTVNASCVGALVGLNEGDVIGSFCNSDTTQWKPIGDTPRSESQQDVAGLSAAEYQKRAA